MEETAETSNAVPTNSQMMRPGMFHDCQSGPDGSTIDDDSVSTTSSNTPLTKIVLINASDYAEMMWKNGLGKSLQIVMSPQNTHFPDGDFSWRLSTGIIKSACGFSKFPGYRRVIILLPRIISSVSRTGKALFSSLESSNHSSTSTNDEYSVNSALRRSSVMSDATSATSPPISLSSKENATTPTLAPSSPSTFSTSTSLPYPPFIKLQHLDTASTIKLNHLVPYSFDASTTIQCEFPMISENPSNTSSDVSLKSLLVPSSGSSGALYGPCQHLTLLLHRENHGKPSISVETIDSDSSFRRLLLAPVTIVFVVSGQLYATIDGVEEMIKLKTGQTLMIERSDSTPISLKANVVPQRHSSLRLTETQLLQQNLNQNLFLDSAMNSPSSSFCSPGIPAGPISGSTFPLKTPPKVNALTQVEASQRMRPSTVPEPEDCVFVLFELHEMQPSETVNSPSISSTTHPSFSSPRSSIAMLPPPVISPLIIPRDKQVALTNDDQEVGSILVYDDQPLWALPQDLADKMETRRGSVEKLAHFQPSQIYEPPEWSSRLYVPESLVPQPLVRDELILEDFPLGT